MTELVLVDDAVAREFEPFALTRPICELRSGALLLRERWERALGGSRGPATFVSAAHLESFDEPWGARSAGGTLRKGTVVANSRCAVSLAPAQRADAWRLDGRIAAVVLSRDVDVAELAGGAVSLDSLAASSGAVSDIGGRWLEHVWDFIAYLAPMLAEDIMALTSQATRLDGDRALVRGTHGVYAEDEATIEPQVFFDTSAGPVLVRRGATVLAFTRIVGPCIIGPESQVGGDKVASSSIGEVCKVHGEVNTAIFLGHANKGHEGFLGHSYVGRWVNLGAGTTTSNLKNTYGPVTLWTPRGERDTGQQFLGTMFGDHVKTGIGVTLTTGTVVGAAANVFGAAATPKVVSPWAWGDREPYDAYDLDKFLQVTRRVMSRRHVELSDRAARQLTSAHARRWKADGAP